MITENTPTDHRVIVPALEAVHVAAGGGMFVELGDHRGYGKLPASATGGTLLFTELHSDYRGGVPEHIHAREDETFYILEGRFEFVVGDTTIEAGPGDTLFAPRGVPHSWLCVSLEGAKAIGVITPGANFEEFIIEVGRRGISPAIVASNDAIREEYLDLCAKHGIRFTGR